METKNNFCEYIMPERPTVFENEKTVDTDCWKLEARERYWIHKYQSVKNQAMDVVEHGLNLKG